MNDYFYSLEMCVRAHLQDHGPLEYLALVRLLDGIANDDA